MSSSSLDISIVGAGLGGLAAAAALRPHGHRIKRLALIYVRLDSLVDTRVDIRDIDHEQGNWGCHRRPG